MMPVRVKVDNNMYYSVEMYKILNQSESLDVCIFALNLLLLK